MNPSAAYIIPDTKVKSFYDKIPTKMRRQIPALKWAIKNAIASVESEGESVEWLVFRWNAYLKSEEGSGKFFRSPMRWLQDEAWGEPDEAWGAREKESAKPLNIDRIIDNQVSEEVAKKKRVRSERADILEYMTHYSDTEIDKAMKSVRKSKPYLPEGDPRRSWILAVAAQEYLEEKDGITNTADTENPS